VIFISSVSSTARRWRLARFDLFALAALLSAVVGLCVPQTSKALACGTGFNRFDGANTTSQQYYGVWGTINTKTPTLCTGASVTVSTAWVMLAGSGGNDAWAQVGYGNFANFDSHTGMYTFSEAKLHYGDTPTHVFLPPPAAGTSPVYEAAYSSTEHNVWLIQGGTLVAKTTFDPYSNWTSPVQSQIFAETYHCEDNVIGTQASAAGFNSLGGELSPGASFTNFSDLALQTPDCARHHNQWGANPTLFYTWTF
jgi:hypothetical protein